jgi:AcrR family transcriptional regulator
VWAQVPSAAEHDAESARTRVLDVGAKLFSAHGPRLVTMKWVAMEAEVPLEWLDDRWPSVEALLGDVLEHEAQQLSSASPTLPVIYGEAFTSVADGVLDVYDRIMVRAILDGTEPAALQRTFPVIERLVAALQRDGLDEPTARARAFQIALLELGLRLLGPTLATACGLAEGPADDAVDLVRRLQRTLSDATFRDGSDGSLGR